MSFAIRLRVEARDTRRVEPGERVAVAVALVEDRRPAQAGLRAFEDQEFEEHAVVVDRHAPFVVVIGRIARTAVSPRTAGEGSGHGRQMQRVGSVDYRTCRPTTATRHWRVAESPRDSPGSVRARHFRRSTPRSTIPTGCSRRATDLTPARLLDAYRRGIFPWYSDDQPVLWWSPDPRMVLFDRRVSHRALAAASVVQPGALRDSRRHRLPRRDGGVRGGSAPGAERHLDHAGDRRRVFRAARARLRALGRGVARRRTSSAVSTASRSAGCSSASRCSHDETDASKVALVHLVGMLRARGFPLIDCQQETAHLASVRRAADSAESVCRASRRVGKLRRTGQRVWTPLPAIEGTR